MTEQKKSTLMLVLEAVQPVKLTPLAAWTARGAGA